MGTLQSIGGDVAPAIPADHIKFLATEATFGAIFEF
jgi:hypothetical protein